ncbi:unnamed protein product [Rangifer tarandus platyrhynchus]|uniref:Uncharacterized protein n=2 Tax=Rangifer tarandus platyrhynchus TaxID=3082113 RepID=A0ABN8Y943_RANTA|nr:unnamed protein product [Rangifer tarandus platyrhynchus]CAI9696189.1 unnamed protein product [Rangifer tarandus platyrhynchus]
MYQRTAANQRERAGWEQGPSLTPRLQNPLPPGGAVRRGGRDSARSFGAVGASCIIPQWVCTCPGPVGVTPPGKAPGPEPGLHTAEQMMNAAGSRRQDPGSNPGFPAHWLCDSGQGRTF